MSQARNRGDGERPGQTRPDRTAPEREPRNEADRGYDRATRGGEPVSADAYGREAVQLAAEETEEPRGSADPDWNGAPEMAGIGEQRTWEAWNPEEELHDRVAGEPPAPEPLLEGESADAAICGEIQQRLDDQHLDTKTVRISVAAGAVVLDGSVEDPETRRRVERLVSNTPGVRDTVNHLDVRAQRA